MCQTQKYQVFDMAASIKDFNANSVLKKRRLMFHKVLKKAKQKFY